MSTSHPLVLGCPPRWANSWGQDRYGLFVGFIIDDIECRMRWIGPGRFLMGSPETEEGRVDDEGPQHEVRLTRGFWLGETPVTQALWGRVMRVNPSRFKGPDHPVESVSWEDCQQFCTQLEALVPGLCVRLPSEAEWEYACRAGTTGPTYAGAGQQVLETIAWWAHNSQRRTHPVRQKQPNAWGLYDMLGNVFEWCCDSLRTYGWEPAVDPVGSIDGVRRVNRGGSWTVHTGLVRAASRFTYLSGHGHDHLGLRLVIRQD